MSQTRVDASGVYEITRRWLQHLLENIYVGFSNRTASLMNAAAVDSACDFRLWVRGLAR